MNCYQETSGMLSTSKGFFSCKPVIHTVSFLSPGSDPTCGDIKCEGDETMDAATCLCKCGDDPNNKKGPFCGGRLNGSNFGQCCVNGQSGVSDLE